MNAKIYILPYHSYVGEIFGGGCAHFREFFKIYTEIMHFSAKGFTCL